MRVISGLFKGKKLFSPKHEGLRPTSDKVKESMFNILASKDKPEGGFVLDLFCGSGALGIEALSRGAALAVFVDNNPLSVRLAKQNLAHTGAGPAEVYIADYRTALKRLAGRSFDLIFLDPPYGGDMLAGALSLIEKHGILSPGGIIVCEHGQGADFTAAAQRCIIETRTSGSTFISFLRLAQEDVRS